MTRPRPVRAERIRALILDSEPWLSCGECFARVDGYVERLLSGRPSRDEALGVHLVACPACLNEAQSLVTLRGADLGIGPPVALQALGEDLAAYLRS
jgi:hypothetical protein